MSTGTPLEIADWLERPTERDLAAIHAIREASQSAEEFRSRAHSLAIRVEALEEENRRLREWIAKAKKPPRKISTRPI